ncbi:DUF4132 domain-containing protein [Dactylosporangium siamense]|uniref:DUF4132 domain-containing protein n=1 Tax=Dactylosporangium siamense TaxID=685454 RepID=A0A919PWE7_9ACTN|nr:DUF4132 domain-containing protein [Dactylosporangium siamense]GIG51517.1 hypothetical protein Dsi01nite_095580 [Dactylosporangium siamense]
MTSGPDLRSTVLAWEDGERDRWWSRATALEHGREQPDWGAAVARADDLSNLTPAQLSWLIVRGPESSARALLGKSLILLRHGQRIDLDRVAVARFGLDALPLVLRDAGGDADRLGLLVLPFRGAEVATLIAGWLRHLGSARLWARLWLQRHADVAMRTLTPVAEGRPGRAQQQAEDALRFLEAASGVPSLFAVPAYATRKGRPPAWTRPDRLPELQRAGGGALPHDQVARVVEALGWSRLAGPPEPAPGSDGAVPVAVESSVATQPLVQPAEPEARERIAGCDPASLAAFGRAVLHEWVEDGAPPAESWALLAQAHIGDDATMDVLAPLVRSWPALSRYARAIDGFAVLATVGTDAALRQLVAIEENMSGGATNERATNYLTQAAARRGLSVTQLADRLAATHGLDTGVTLDYGPRAFTVVTDDHLNLRVVDLAGRPVARPPKPGVKDTDPDAYQRFLQLKKDLRATVAAQSTRLQRDLLARRFRPARDLPAVVLPHPILGPLARRLLWGEYDQRRRLIRALRIAEDGSFADLHDSAATVDGDALLGLVHPADLGPDLAHWMQLCTDYEILPPFPQLHRPVVTLTEAERAATGLTGFGPLSTGRALELMHRRAWRGNGSSFVPSRPHTQLAHDLPDGLSLLVEITPGADSAFNAPSDQQVTEIWLDDAWSDHLQLARHLPLGTADPAALSELLVELRGGSA